jgi:hypothetical protein
MLGPHVGEEEEARRAKVAAGIDQFRIGSF